MVNVDVEVPAGPRRVLADQARLIGLVDGGLKLLAFADEFTTDIDVTDMRAHREASDQATFDQLLGIVTQDVPVLAGAGLGLVGIDDQVVRAAVGFLRHEGPFEAGRKTSAAATAQARLLHFVENPVAALRDDSGRAVPVAARPRAGEPPVLMAVEIGENPILVFQHHSLPPDRASTDVRLVSLPRGSEECRALWGPGFTSFPSRRSARILSSVAGSRSS